MIKPKVVIDSALRITPQLRAMPVELVPVVGRDICNESVLGADALLTRTVTRVDEQLLAGSGLKFVGTASAGTDHVDTNYLAENNIAFASAAGCNASAVGDYVLAAISLCGRLETVTDGADVGLVGYGHVGRSLANRLTKLGARVKVYDPWVDNVANGVQAAALKDVLSCSVVSLHAALNKSEPFPSYHMIGVKEAETVGEGTLFINAGRGGLVTPRAAERLLERGIDVVLDTWPDEPYVPINLLSGVRYGTPHIAGYSESSKNNATDFLIPALVDALELACDDIEAEADNREAKVLTNTGDDLEILSQLLRDIGRIEQDDRDFRNAWKRDQSAATFEMQRSEYAMRQQLEGLSVSADTAVMPRLACWLKGLGVALV